jgi:hypothetical protein
MGGSRYSVCPGGACCMGVSIACVPVERHVDCCMGVSIALVPVERHVDCCMGVSIACVPVERHVDCCVSEHVSIYQKTDIVTISLKVTCSHLTEQLLTKC